MFFFKLKNPTTKLTYSSKGVVVGKRVKGEAADGGKEAEKEEEKEQSKAEKKDKKKKKKKVVDEEEDYEAMLVKERKVAAKFDRSVMEFELEKKLLLDADLQLVFFYGGLMGKKMFQFWAHTRFVDRSTLRLKLGKNGAG